ncbi:hypothetical protein IQE94_14120 [Synechocystis sp. PCC 7339]|nr:hypothetical protein [Synechocystis sp. PCC 7339]UAJ72208.1 hypothetical protein IQE94_14120 [Synechocystis sp. PCC 7339]
MRRNVKITFYEIINCGYYAGDESLKFGDIHTILDDIYSFAHNDSVFLAHTRTFDESRFSDIDAIYCCDL